MKNAWQKFKNLKTWQKVVSVIVVLTIIGAISNAFNGNSNENIETPKESSVASSVEKSKTESIEESERSEYSTQTANESSSKAVPHRTGELIIGESNKTFEDNDINVTFSDYVRNDTTDNWRLARIASNINIAEYVLDYYNNYFKDDKEVHAIVNFTTKTTTNITVSTGMAFVTIHEYVSGEENNAKELFGGKVLESYIVYLDNGDIERIADEESAEESSEIESSVESSETTFYVAESSVEPSVTPITEPEQEKTYTFVLNTHTHKFHLPGCSSVNEITEENKEIVNIEASSLDEAMSKVDTEFQPCKKCL